MKKLILLSLLTLQFGLLAAQNADGQGRLSHLFNFGWKFHAGDLKDAYSCLLYTYPSPRDTR